MDSNEQVWSEVDLGGSKIVVPFSEKEMKDYYAQLEKEATRFLYWPAPTNVPTTIRQWPVHYKLKPEDQTKTGVLLENDMLYEVSTDDNPKRTDLYVADLDKPICHKSEAAMVKGFSSFDF